MGGRGGFYAELVGIFLLVCAAGAVFNEGDFAFVDSTLNPFMLVVAILAIQYGLTEALIGTATAVVLYLLGTYQKYGAFDLLANNRPVVFFSLVATGLLLGLTQESRNRSLRQARSELEDVRNEAERLRQRLNVVNAANQKLNERILGEVNTVQSFSEIARRLSVLEEKDLYPALCDLVLEFLHASEASVYMLTAPDKLVLTAQRGWESVPREAMVLMRGQDLLWTAIDQQRAVTALDLDGPVKADFDEDLARRYRRLVCAPIIHPQTGQVMGVVSADRLPFAHFHGNSVSLLGVIAKWAGDSLYNAATFREVATQLAGDELMKGCIPPILFRDRASQEVAREDGPVSFVCLLMQGYHALGRDEQVQLRRLIYGVLSPMVTGRVVLGRLSEGLYGLLLPEVDDSGAQSVRDHLVQGLRSQVKGSAASSEKISLLVGSSRLPKEEIDLDGLIRYAHQNMVRC